MEEGHPCSYVILLEIYNEYQHFKVLLHHDCNGIVSLLTLNYYSTHLSPQSVKRSHGIPFLVHLICVIFLGKPLSNVA